MHKEIWKFNEEKHVVERIQKRNPKCNPKDELDRIKRILQENVPDDWRLTRFSQDFLIRDLRTDITLVGYQTRLQNTTTIIKHVTTALPVAGFSKAKLGKHIESLYARDIAERPNIFLGDETIHPVFEFSPVLARQYEKVVYEIIKKVFTISGHKFTRAAKVKLPREYFRLHPLKSSGIDPKFEPVWMEWISEKGGCRFIKGGPPNGYHGEDFWILQEE